MSGQKWLPLPGASPAAKARQARDCTMPRLLRELAPGPSCLPISALPPTHSLHAFLSLLSYLLFILSPLFTLILPSLVVVFKSQSSVFFSPSLLPSSLWAWRRVSVVLSQAVSLRLCPLTSSWSQSGPGPAEGYMYQPAAAQEPGRVPSRLGWRRC